MTLLLYANFGYYFYCLLLLLLYYFKDTYTSKKPFINFETVLLYTLEVCTDLLAISVFLGAFISDSQAFQVLFFLFYLALLVSLCL